MKIITDCPICETDFMYDPNHDYHLEVDLNNPNGIRNKYTVKDDTWPGRRWNEEKTHSIDLSGKAVVCQDCHEKRSKTEDVNVDGHVVCQQKGCANDANEYSKYCDKCYDEKY